MTTFDPRAPLAAAPDPWEELPQPSVRDGPPFHMTDMIAAEPFLAERILERLDDPQGPAGRLAGAIGQAASSGAPIIVTGCGTSEHAAMAAVEILREGLRFGGLPSGPSAILAAQAFELSLDPPNGGLVIGISHEGGTTATIRGARGVGRAGARTAMITGSAGSPAAAAASDELVVATVEMDHGWCHTVGYLSPDRRRGGDRRELADDAARPARSSATSSPPAPPTRRAPRRSPPASPAAATILDGRVRRGPAGRPRARAEDRGGRLDPVDVARPRDVPARPPAGDGRDDRPRPDPDRSRRARGAGRPGASGPGRGPSRRAPGGRDRRPRRPRPARRRPDAGRPDPRRRGARPCRRRSRPCSAPRRRSSS